MAVRKIFFNGKVLTQDEQLPEATAFIVEDGNFTKVGSDEEILSAKKSDDILIDLNKKFVIPGFNDAHIHIWKVGNLIHGMLDLRGVKSITEMQEMLSAYAAKNPQLNWIQARGFNEADFIEQRMPTKADLDAIPTDKPICVTRTCAHQIIVNTKALELAEIDIHTPVPKGGEMKLLADGTVAGHFTETAIGLIISKIPKYTAAELREMILAAQKQFLQYGITAATDPAVDRDLLQVYKQMDADGELIIRINAIPIRVPDGANKVYPNPEPYHSEHLVVNTVKFFADGGISGKTAALIEPYKNSNEHGVLRLEKNIFRQLAKESQDAGFMLATHAIGDAAIDMVIDVYTSIAPFNDKNLCHRIEHLGLPSHEHLEAMFKYHIAAIMQPIFISELGNNFLNYVPEHYLNYLYPVRSVLDYGVQLALSTDAPVVKSYHPLYNIHAALYRSTNNGITISPQQKITLAEALYAYTMGSAKVTGAHQKMGSITSGKWADFTVLNSFDPHPDQVEQTYIAGNPQL